MLLLSDLYPESPRNGNEIDLEPSPAFRRDAIKVFGAILFFVFVYVVLFAVAIALAALCGYGGYKLIVEFPRIHTIAIGIGLAGMGAMVVFFLIKFLFTKTKNDRPDWIEVTEQDQPVLFAFVRKLTIETGSQFPGKIFLSADVNASVFYNSGFWSMLFPVQKNLHIGLGLVNSVNLSELKAILAHEFGHFSQRSMKFGSYVYHLNRIIYNLLYENDGYGRTLDRWSDISGYFAFFASVNVRMIQGIQWVLQQVYRLVNLQYLSLSRQMEFHADSVAASVCGSNHLVSSLRRLEFSNNCYERLLEYYRDWYKQCLKPGNLFQQHRFLMETFARNRGLAIEDGLPVVTAQSLAKYHHSRIVVRDQWSSHPSIADREKNVNRLNAQSEPNNGSAWKIFLEVESLQRLATNKCFDSDTFESPPKTLDLHLFREKVEAERAKYRLDKRYRGFFDGRFFAAKSVDEIVVDANEAFSDLDGLLNDEALMLPYLIDGLNSDIRSIEMIQSGTIPAKSFEFAGRKMGRNQIPYLYETLQNELADAEDNLQKVDYQIIRYFLRQAASRGEENLWRARYKEVLKLTKSGEADLELYMQIVEAIEPLHYGPPLAADDIRILMAKARNLEGPMRIRLSEMMNDARYAGLCNNGERKVLEEYIAKDYSYFVDPPFDVEKFSVFTTALAIFHNLSAGKAMNVMKQLLDDQLVLEAEKATF